MILPDTVLLWTALVIAALALAVGIVTVLLAAWYHYRTDRNERIRGELKPALFERLFSDDPDWDAWIDELSRRERRQLRTLLDEYLRQLRGTEHARLCVLADTLGVTDRAKRNLTGGRNRLRALTWLALLDEPVEPDLLEASCGKDPQLRAAAARVLHNSGTPDASTIGTELLIGDGDRSLSAFGMDTLYQLNNGTETPLLSIIEDSGAWNTRLLVQTLLVIRHCDISDPGRLTWLSDALEHESSRVRAAAVGVAERHAWRDRLRAEIDIESLLTDSEPAVREDTYLLLAAWNTEESAAWLRHALTTADRADSLALTRAVFQHSRLDLSDAPTALEPFVEWVRADEAVGRKRRVWGVSAAWS